MVIESKAYKSIGDIREIVYKNLYNEVSNPELITEELISFVADEYDDCKIIARKVKALLNPKEMQEKELFYYLSAMKAIISYNIIIDYFYTDVFPDYDENTFPKKIYDLFKKIEYYSKNNINDINDITGVLLIMSIIISYLYANDISDYSLVDNFLENSPYYLEKLKLHGIDASNSELYELPCAIYNNISILFRKEKTLIK